MAVWIVLPNVSVRSFDPSPPQPAVEWGVMQAPVLLRDIINSGCVQGCKVRYTLLPNSQLYTLALGLGAGFSYGTSGNCARLRHAAFLSTCLKLRDTLYSVMADVGEWVW